MSWLGCVAYGIADEYHQSFVPNRDSSPLDVGFDSLGSALSMLGLLAVSATRGRETETGRVEGWLAAQGAGQSLRHDSDHLAGPPTGSRVPGASGDLLSIYVLLVVGVVRLSLWVLPLPTARRLFSWVARRPAGRGTRGRSPDGVADAVRRLSRLVPRASCLTQAFAAAILLRQAGFECTVSLGVARAADHGRLKAHAWVESGGRILVGGEVAGGFKRVAVLEI